MSFKFQDKLIDQIVNDGRDMVIARYSAGKCRVSLLAAARLTKPGDLVIILSPKRNIHTWLQEAPKWWKSQTNALHESSAPDDPFLSPGTRAQDRRHLIVLSHRKVDSMMEIIKQLGPAVVILDESTAIKNPKASLAECCHRLAAVLPECRRLSLTGDPTPESPTEIWSQMQFCYGSRNPFGDTYYRFLNRWFLKTDYSWAMRLDKEEAFNTLLDRYSCRMDEEDVAEHKAIVGCREEYETIYYDASDEQLRLMKALYSDWALPTADMGVEEYWHTMSILQKAQQIAGGFYYTGTYGGSGVASGRPVALRANPKLDVLETLVKGFLAQGEQRIVVWHAYELEYALINNRLTDHVHTVTELPAMLEHFAGDADYPIVAILPLAAGKGINDLIKARYDIYYSNVFSQETRNQCEARLPRPGQKAEVVRHIDLASVHLADHKVVLALQNKQLTTERLNTIVTELFPPVKGQPSSKSYRERRTRKELRA